MKNETPSKLMTCKELADAKGRNVRYVYDARRNGFSMPGERATLEAFDEFLVRNPPPSRIRQQKQNSQK